MKPAPFEYYAPETLQEAIALVKKSITDFPLQYGNFRD